MIIFRKRVSGAAGLDRFALMAQRAAGVRGEVNILLTSSRQMQALNSKFRKKNAATDVLSFPATEPADGVAGDIAISVDIAARNAAIAGHSMEDEIKILMLHGLLHLAGFDHEADVGEMALREGGLRRRFGLPVGLLERNGQRDGGTNSGSLTTKDTKDTKAARRKTNTTTAENAKIAKGARRDPKKQGKIMPRLTPRKTT